MVFTQQEQSLIGLIKEYIQCAKYYTGLLSDSYDGDESILRAYRSGLIAKEGYLDSGSVYYCMHGIGCYFESQNDSIDIDFGPDDQCEGFDLSRLSYFLENRKDRYKGFSSESLGDSFQSLIDKGVVYHARMLPSVHLFYLKDNSWKEA